VLKVKESEKLDFQFEVSGAAVVLPATSW